MMVVGLEGYRPKVIYRQLAPHGRRAPARPTKELLESTMNLSGAEPWLYGG
jgi:hypothetical protein